MVSACFLLIELFSNERNLNPLRSHLYNFLISLWSFVLTTHKLKKIKHTHPGLLTKYRKHVWAIFCASKVKIQFDVAKQFLPGLEDVITTVVYVVFYFVVNVPNIELYCSPNSTRRRKFGCVTCVSNCQTYPTHQSHPKTCISFVKPR